MVGGQVGMCSWRPLTDGQSGGRMGPASGGGLAASEVTSNDTVAGPCNDSNVSIGRSSAPQRTSPTGTCTLSRDDPSIVTPPAASTTSQNDTPSGDPNGDTIAVASTRWPIEPTSSLATSTSTRDEPAITAPSARSITHHHGYGSVIVWPLATTTPSNTLAAGPATDGDVETGGGDAATVTVAIVADVPDSAEFDTAVSIGVAAAGGQHHRNRPNHNPPAPSPVSHHALPSHRLTADKGSSLGGPVPVGPRPAHDDQPRLDGTHHVGLAATAVEAQAGRGAVFVGGVSAHYRRRCSDGVLEPRQSHAPGRGRCHRGLHGPSRRGDGR